MHEKKKRKKGGGGQQEISKRFICIMRLFSGKTGNAPYEEESCIEMTSPRQSAVNTVDISR